jgi:transglutaminase superfamily protein
MQFLFWKILIGLFAFDLCGLGRNFSRMYRAVQSWEVAPRTPTPDVVDRVSAALNWACIWYPKRVLCLQRSVVMTCILRDLGIHAQMVMGAQRVPFKAHAWTEVDGRAINERRDVQSIYGVWERC